MKLPKIKHKGPKILLIDIETKPMLSYIWRLFEDQGGLPMLHNPDNPMSILSFSAQWYDPKEEVEYPIIYMDQRDAKDIEDEKAMLIVLRDLLDEADIVIGHNSKQFDIKTINSRLVKHNIKRPSDYRQIDTLTIARKHFNFPSNKLEFLARYLGCTVKKLTDREFPGIKLWLECLARNKKAWKEMELYNKRDVEVLKEVYKKLIPWDKSIDFSVYYQDNLTHCTCGSTSFRYKGVTATNAGLYERYVCKSCGKPHKLKTNILSKAKRDLTKKPV
jgi:DNA polymerase elongation subunit (family B)